MAEIMNEFSSSNGEVDDENNEVKLNGDACDNVSNIATKSPLQQKEDQLHDSISSKDKRSSSHKKLDCLNEDNNTDYDKTREQSSVKTCLATTIVANVANGRLKSDVASNAENDENGHENKLDEPQLLSPSAVAKKRVIEVKSVTNDCNSSSSKEHVIDGDDTDDSGFSNCDSIKAESGRQSNPKTDDDTYGTTKDDAAASNATNSQPNVSMDENGTKHDDEIVATDLSKRINDSATDKKSDSNGGDEDDEANEDDEVISISSTPDRSKKSSKKPSMSIVNITPRRSSRNLNKQKSYAEKDADFESSGSDGVSIVNASRKRPAGGTSTCEDDEIQEVTPTDPLADEPGRSSASKMRGNKTIVVSDTKGLVEFASNTKASRSNKKEPTLVIIDTNSILSGRGPIPVSQQATSGSLLHSSSSSAPIPVSLPIPAGAFANATRGSTPSSSAFSVIPIGLPAQGMYSQFKNPPPQIKPIVVGPASTSVTPVPIAQSTVPTSLSATTITTVASTQSSNKQPPVILPSLTDDMFVVEAPSFIVPYVYEKPPMRSLKEHIEKIESDIKLQAAEEAQRERVEGPKDSTFDKTTQSDNEEKSAFGGDAVVVSSKDKVADSAKEDAAKDDSSQPDQDSECSVKDQINEQDKSDVDKKDTSKEGSDLVERMEVDEEAHTAFKSAATTTTPSTVESDTSSIVKKMEIDSSPVNAVKEIEKKITAGPTTGTDDPKKPVSYFDNPLGKFFMQIGLNLVQEHVQTDLLRSQKRKRDKEGGKCSQDVHSAIDELTKTLESSKENNDPFKLELKKCELCSFKTESLLVMAHHLETPHMKNYTYRCNFCTLEVRSPHDILFHMEAEHNIRGRLERAPAFHQCPNCPFEDNQKGKLTRHLISCSKKYRPERNQEPPLDWEPPAKIPRVTRNRPPSMSPGNAVYQAAMSGLKQVPQNTLLPKLMPNTTNMKHNMLNAANKRPNLANTFVNRFPNAANAQPNFQQRPISMQTPNQGMMFRAGGTNSQTPVLLPQGYHLSGAQIYQTQNNKSQSTQQSIAAAKLLNQPSISITPLPRQTSASNNTSSSNMKSGGSKPMNSIAAASKGGGNFVVCEICDGYIKDLEQLRNHMQWIHKVKIHPKMIYNRPPLNCQKCQERFFTDQGLERHLLGAHGLVTSSMQEAANKGKDGGRCPVCGRVYQWKLLNHVARDHQMALKPAHLSYKCTVCTATFGMYKQFESHVYSAHSVVAKRAMDTSKKPPPVPSSSQNDTLLKPLKINDEITIIPQPVRSTRPSNKESNAATITKTMSGSKKMDCETHDNDNSSNNKDDTDDQQADDGLCKCVCSMGNFADYETFRKHVTEKHLKHFKIILSRLDLNSLNRVPNKENAFKLTKFDRKLISNEVRDRYKLSDFFIEIKRLILLSDYKYQIVENQRRIERVENSEDVHVMPEALYSDTEESDQEKKSQNGILLPNKLHVQSIAEQHLSTFPNVIPAPSSALVSTKTATFNGGKQKRLMSRGRRNAARQSARQYATDSYEIDSSTSDDDVNLIDERRLPQHNTTTSNPFADHFMSELASFSPSSSITGQDYSYLFASTSCSVMSQRMMTASHQTTIGAKNRSLRYQQFAMKRASRAPFTIFNRQKMTASTSSSAFGSITPRLSGLAKGDATANAFNASNSVQFIGQRSVKVTNKVIAFCSTAGMQHQQQHRPLQQNTHSAPQNVSNKLEAVISLLSDSDSDQSAVEIVDCDPTTSNSDDNDLFILPT